MIKIILADDHYIVRNGIRNLLEKDGRFEVIAEASNAIKVFELLDKGFVPDIVLTDMTMPVISGDGKHEGIKIVLLTIIDNDQYIVQAFKSGATGYLLKSIGTEELVFALMYIHNQNKKYISSELSIRLLDRVSNLPNAFSADGDGAVAFSKRETEVLFLISEGFTNQQIADKLFTSRRTVEGHRQSLMDKADVSNSAALVRFAFRNNLLD